MHLVESPTLFPGVCTLTNSGSPGPFIDLLRENVAGERLYVAQDIALDMARFLGCASPQEKAALEEKVEQLERENAKLRHTAAKYEALKSSVATTLAAGAVIRRVDGEDRPVLRSKPGEKRVDLD